MLQFEPASSYFLMPSSLRKGSAISAKSSAEGSHMAGSFV